MEDLKELTLVELKALFYDTLVKKETAERDLAAINAEVAAKANEKPKT